MFDNQQLEVKIVFENRDFLVLDKPAGMIVNKAQTTKKQYTLQDWAQDYLKESVLPFKLRFGLVHRLDKETCGLMLLAKSEQAYWHFLEQFKKRNIKKKYITLVNGKISPKKGTICMPIKRDPRNRKKFSVFVGGKMSETHYELINIYQNPKQKIKSKKYFSLLKIDLKTGRTHQIRVHFSHLHYPVVSDQTYAGKKTRRSDRSWCPHIFLQSMSLSFFDHEKVEHCFELPLNRKLKEGLEQKLEIVKELE